MVLYLITNLINGKQYVGITKDPDDRLTQHFSGFGSKLVYAATKKYGVENFEFEILLEGCDVHIKLLEKLFITALETKAPTGYNLTDGGEGLVGYKPSEETRRKQSIAATGRKRTIAHQQKLNESHTGKKRSLAARERMSKAKLGNKQSSEHLRKLAQQRVETHPTPETLKKLSNIRKKENLSAETRQKLSKAHSGGNNPAAKQVCVEGIQFRCIKDAADYLGIQSSTLRKRMRVWAKNNRFPSGYKYL